MITAYTSSSEEVCIESLREPEECGKSMSLKTFFFLPHSRMKSFYMASWNSSLNKPVLESHIKSKMRKMWQNKEYHMSEGLSTMFYHTADFIVYKSIIKFLWARASQSIFLHLLFQTLHLGLSVLSLFTVLEKCWPWLIFECTQCTLNNAIKTL